MPALIYYMLKTSFQHLSLLIPFTIDFFKFNREELSFLILFIDFECVIRSRAHIDLNSWCDLKERRRRRGKNPYICELAALMVLRNKGKREEKKNDFTQWTKRNEIKIGIRFLLIKRRTWRIPSNLVRQRAFQKPNSATVLTKTKRIDKQENKSICKFEEYIFNIHPLMIIVMPMNWKCVCICACICSKIVQHYFTPFSRSWSSTDFALVQNQYQQKTILSFHFDSSSICFVCMVVCVCAFIVAWTFFNATPNA